jgi:diguanylate cyclase (GGDEF)-like protein
MSSSTERDRDVPLDAGSRHGRLWRIAAWSCLVVGLTGSMLGGWAWSQNQNAQAKRSFSNTASIVDSGVDAELQRDLDLQTSLGRFIAADPNTTNAQLGPWLRLLDIAGRYPGTEGLSYYEPVSAAQLPSYEAAVRSDPVPGVGAGPYPIFPPGRRPGYCLLRLGIQTEGNGFPAGSDLCSGPPTKQAVLRATQTGQPQFIGYGTITAAVKALHLPATTTQTLRHTVVEVSAVYAGGVRPTTEKQRESTVIGWIVSNFNGSTLLDDAIASTPGLSVALSSPAEGRIAEVGKVMPGTMVTRSTLDESGLSVTVREPASNSDVAQGFGIAGLGALLSASLFAFLLHLGRSREKALRLVDQRTGELRHLALHDALTDLPNRSLLFDRAEQMLSRVRRSGGVVGALFVDLDNFKEVNDTFGHDTGDELIRAVAYRLSSTIRESDTVGRLGGDEFLVLTEDVTTEGGPELLAERILAVLDEPFVLSGSRPITLNVRASIGVAAGPRDSATELIRDADIALYQAKDAGRGCSVVFSPEMHMAVHDRMSLELDLRGALGRGELFVEYQPIFDLHSMKAKGVEALVRWRHPDRGVLAPEEFIPLAERSGSIRSIGGFVLDQACSQAAAWHRAGYQFQMSVNVSVAQFRSPEIVDEVRALLEHYRLPAEDLILEITETMLMRDVPETRQTLQAFRDMGVRIAVDDFGTGYSSLAYLRQFPIDSLKIDQSFVTRTVESSQAVAILHTLVQLGKSLGIETLAEGIEQQPQLEELQHEKCDSGQGFLFSKPLPPDKVLAFLARHSDAPVKAASAPSGSRHLRRPRRHANP